MSGEDEGEEVDYWAGETVADGFWYLEVRAPICGNGSNRIADLGERGWLVAQAGDDGPQSEIVPRPKTADQVVDLLEQLVAIDPSYACAAALELEPLDPQQTLSPVARSRFERALEGHAEAVGEGALEGRWGGVSFSVSEDVLELLKSRLRKNSRDYEVTRLALERPSDPAVRGFSDTALQGDDSGLSWDDLIDEL